MTPEGLYGRRKMTALVRRHLPSASAGSVDRAMRTLGLSGIRRSKGIRTTIPAKDGKRAGDLLNQRLRVETKALGGYIDAQSGRKLAIAIIVNQAMFDDLQGVFAANEDLGKIATSLYEAY